MNSSDILVPSKSTVVVCRVCLEENTTFLNVFFTESIFNRTIATLIMECAPIQISLGDGFSELICNNCYEKLQTSYQFRMLCIQSDNELRSKYDELIKQEKYFTETDCLITQDLFSVNNSTNKHEKDIFSENVNLDDAQTDTVWPQIDIQKEDKINTATQTQNNGKVKRKQKVEKEYVVKEESDSDSKSNHDCVNNGFNDIDTVLSISDNEESKEEEKSTCPICFMSFTRKRTLFNHMKNIHNENDGERVFKCELCDSSYTTLKILNCHKSKVHRINKNIKPKTSQEYACDICDKVFKHLKPMENHKKKHVERRPMNGNPFTCDTCGKFLHDSTRLWRHIKTVHSKERPFECKICNKSFKDKVTLGKHDLTHNNQMLFLCEQCGMGFRFVSNLYKHYHIHSDVRKYMCDICGKSFKTEEVCKKHKIIHTGEKPYQCVHCKKRFNAKRNLKAHQVVHTNERPFKCDICNEVYRSRTRLLLHKQGHV